VRAFKTCWTGADPNDELLTLLPINGKPDRASVVAAALRFSCSACSENSGTRMISFDSPGESLLDLGHKCPLDEPGGPVRVLVKTHDAAVLKLEDKLLERSRDEI
jgi:hypothetical protein